MAGGRCTIQYIVKIKTQISLMAQVYIFFFQSLSANGRINFEKSLQHKKRTDNLYCKNMVDYVVDNHTIREKFILMTIF